MYAITTQNDRIGKVEDFGQAREIADDHAKEAGVEVKVVLVMEDGNTIHAYAATPVQAGHTFAPWQRIENPKFQAPAFAGFVPAYTRKRIQATVYRSEAHEGWRVHDGRTGNHMDVENTKAACALTKAMRLGQML